MHFVKKVAKEILHIFIMIGVFCTIVYLGMTIMVHHELPSLMGLAMVAVYLAITGLSILVSNYLHHKKPHPE